MNQMTNPPTQALASASGPLRAGDGMGLGDAPPTTWQAPEAPPELVEIWRALMQRKWAILLLGLLAGGIAAFVVTQTRAPRPCCWKPHPPRW